MINRVKQFLIKHELLDEKKTFLVGFSGGYDSMCLLDILHKISSDCCFEIAALHLNHNWRGAEAALEQANCKRYCEEKNIEFVTETLSEELPKTETCAREHRQVFFKKYYRKFNADALFLAHTKSDNTETVLYRIAKGTGVKGLCGISEHSTLGECHIFRPLMSFTRSEILNYCKENDLSPNHDSSNDNTDYTRNFIRHRVVPQLENINKNLDDTVFQLSKVAVSEQNIIKEYLEKIKNEVTKDGVFCTQKFVMLSSDVQKKFIVEFLIRNNLDYDAQKVEEIYEFLHSSKSLPSGKTLSLTKNLWLFVSQEKIRTTSCVKPEQNNLEIKVDKCGEYSFGGRVFKIEKYPYSKKSEFPAETELKAYVCLEDGFDLTLRTRREGDRISPIGLNGTMKLKKMFINKGVEKFARDDIMLLCKGDEVLWASGVCISEKIKVKGLPTHILSIK